MNEKGFMLADSLIAVFTISLLAVMLISTCRIRDACKRIEVTYAENEYRELYELFESYRYGE